MPLMAAEAPLPCFTSVWHQTSYPSISPARPELSMHGKNVFITGGGSGIGARTVLSYAEAGAANIGIFGRRESRLNDSKAAVIARYPDSRIHIFVGSVTEQKEVERAFSDFSEAVTGKLDVLVSNAAVSGKPFSKIDDTEISAWTSVINTNLLGTFIVTKTFLRHAAPNAVLINVSSVASFVPFGPGLSAYSVSKAATVALYRYLHFERPDLRSVSIQPGGVSTEMSPKSGPMVDDGKFCHTGYGAVIN